jgi:hypothetical protein
MHYFQRIVCTGLLVLCLAPQISGCALLLVGAAGGATAGTAASVNEDRETKHSALTYVGTVLANVVYVPAKVVFAAGGALTSGVSYIATLGRPEPTQTIWSTTTGGDYVMTPSMIEGREPIHFAGSSDARPTEVGRREAERSGA